MNDDTRLNEWFVPKFGPIKFRIICGMLFLPYTGMCVSFVVWGVLFSGSLSIEKLIGIILVYFVSLGVSAHFADSIGSKKLKPWGNIFSRKQAWLIIIFGLGFSYFLGMLLAILFAPMLIIIGIVEGFFLFAYNFELFGGKFHNNFWFSVSWGALPFLAGYVLSVNSITFESLLFSGIPFGLSYVEIKLSRKYKYLKRSKVNSAITDHYEFYLKVLSLSVIGFTIILTGWIILV
ncbi:hypothetical protein [Candidatus Nitrosocosmicus sp. SS]|jgi:hypothetical protein|uniref:hypothetical protein n=1 Tax=Candidatus Nitrosocosmicus agrestis TaxID=2563600 RepID=UPI00122E41F4|nr:hypothetical protein [Candidatus Nitrosocosmicus sp. SS]KAA2280325.1 hypothetical protein F1Z66_11050 [Candidatus Nitrosocosmicus sp. SS]KAF0867748.1 hypothetical protein E5N71_13725 [Candidatus Nitrosocosmicus sp. SS]